MPKKAPKRRPVIFRKTVNSCKLKRCLAKSIHLSMVKKNCGVFNYINFSKKDINFPRNRLWMIDETFSHKQQMHS